MTNYKNDLPLYAEEIIINEETISIQQILSQFKQPVPTNFIELNQLNWMCSTQGWKEPWCERYNCLINGEWKQVDISHALLEQLELAKAKNIPYPVHISPSVVDKGLDCYFAYHIENEREIFLQKPFTIQNLKQNLSKLFQQIEELETKKKENQKTIKDLEKAKDEKNNLEKEIQSFIQELKGEKQMNQSQKNTYQQKVQHLQNRLNQIQNERDALPTFPTLTDYQLLQTERADLQITITQFQNLLGINDLNNLPALPIGETLTSLLARPTLTQLNDLRREKDQQLTTKNTQITNLTNQLNNLQTSYNTVNNQLTTTRDKLQREQGWWDKWISDKRKSFGDNSSQDEKPKYNLWFTVCCKQQSYDYLPRGVHLEYNGSKYREPGTDAFKEQNAKLALKNLIYQYYINQ